MPGLWRKGLLFLAFPLAGLVARSGGHGQNRGPADVLHILTASCLPLHPPGLPATGGYRGPFCGS